MLDPTGPQTPHPELGASSVSLPPSAARSSTPPALSHVRDDDGVSARTQSILAVVLEEAEDEETEVDASTTMRQTNAVMGAPTTPVDDDAAQSTATMQGVAEAAAGGKQHRRSLTQGQHAQGEVSRDG